MPTGPRAPRIIASRAPRQPSRPFTVVAGVFGGLPANLVVGRMGWRPPMPSVPRGVDRALPMHRAFRAATETGAHNVLRRAATEDVGVIDQPARVRGVRAASTGRGGSRGPGDVVRRGFALAAVCLALSSVFGAVDLLTVGGPEMPGLTVGVTHTQNSADSWGAPSAVARARGVLESVAPVQNQHLMGWGAMNPEPSPGVFNFDSLDRRVEMITATGAEPVLTLCCAPDWMTGGEAGSTDWSRLGKAPTPDHYDDFAALAQAAAVRYPAVRRFMVWNEMKGFYDSERNRWDTASYTDLYNHVYQAVKQVRPDALVGGPYVVFDTWSSRDN